MQSSDKLIRRALAGEVRERPPFWLMRQAGRYLPEYREIRANSKNFLDLCFTPELAIEVTLQPIRRYAMDAAILFSDILVIPYALGQNVRFEEGRGPVLDPIRDLAGFQQLDSDDLHERLSPVYKTIEGLRATLPDETALIGFAGAPWTVATYMVEGGSSRNYENVKKWSIVDPEGFQQLIDLLVESTAAYLIEQANRGAEVIQIFDTWAGVLSEPAFERWCLEPITEIVRRLKGACPDVPVIVFPRGTGVQYIRFAKDPMIDGVSLDTATPLAWAKTNLQSYCAVQGNLDPMTLVAGGEALEHEVRRILAALSDGPFIFNLGHGIVPETPPENVALVAETIRNWRR